MARTILQKKKIQRLLILLFGVVVLITSSIIWWGFFTASSVPQENTSLAPQRRVEVDTSILSHPLLEILQEPRAKTQIPSSVGRDNPLLPSL